MSLNAKMVKHTVIETLAYHLSYELLKYRIHSRSKE